MDIQKATELAVSLMEHHGLFLKGYRFEWDNAKRRFGSCSYTNKIISMSRPLAILRAEENVRNTILHEIAHALCPDSGHGREWKLMAMAVGARPVRCGNAAAEGVAIKGKWTGICPAGHTVSRFRQPKRLISCAQCAPYFSKNHLFTWQTAGQITDVESV